MTIQNLGTGNQYGQYTPDFVDYWDDLVGWEGRKASEGGFYEKLLKEAGASNVVDVASGTGFNSINLARSGLEVTATDGSENMLARTRENASKVGVTFAHSQVADWVKLDEELGEERFDALVCLGNSFTHLFEHEARVQAMQAFYRVLRPGGIIIIDHRNYDSMLDGGYSSKHEHYYTGKGVEAYPAELTSTLARFEYRFPDGAHFQLNMFPLRQDYMSELLEQTGFTNLTQYGDFERPFDRNEVDFVQQVAIKPKA
ncbi:class I SAM-dependent methyltransferase [Vreelandella utahensis]|uniref:class I SAM-dependent methyltransferase n=1 Tax=Vreelandella halophila TaxID=86177 RepID=UPI00098583CE|nr:class I SAM-dependent methyltransferase [Halomonas utahensis]